MFVIGGAVAGMVPVAVNAAPLVTLLTTLVLVGLVVFTKFCATVGDCALGLVPNEP